MLAQSNTTALENVAQSMTWRILLHFDGAQSAIQQTDQHANPPSDQQPQFFYSTSGHYDPLSELIATLQAFRHQPQQQCRFPARALYLQTHFSDIKKAHCPEVAAYIENMGSDNLSVIYASGYLGNPASMYGHIFLKFNHNNHHQLLDNTYSYGARYPDDENPFSYIVNGIFGGYQGYFSNQKYHHQTLTYNQTELRNLWEYQLNIDKHAIQLILSHLWELENVPMTYYFFRENCAYQIARILQLAIEIDVIPTNKAWVMPFDIIANLNRHSELIGQVIFHGSRQEALYEKYAQLSQSEKTTLDQILNSTSDTINAILLKLDTDSAKRIIDTLYDYTSYLKFKNHQLSPWQQTLRRTILNTRFLLPPGKSQFIRNPKTPPHAAQHTTLAQFTFFNNHRYGAGNTLRFRANYYDLLSKNSATIPYSELGTFDLNLAYLHNTQKFYVKEFTLLRITNLNLASTGLDDDQSYAWQFATGYREQTLSGQNGQLYLEGFIGKSLSLANHVVGYAALSGELSNQNDLGGYASIGPEFGGILTISPSYRLSISIGQQHYVNAFQLKRLKFSLQQRFFDDQHYDVRALLNYRKTFEISLSMSIYY